MSLANVLAAGLIAAGSSGCVFLDLLFGPGPFDPDASFPPIPVETAPAPAYTSGRATITLTGPDIDASTQPIVLDELVTATSEADLGTHVVWENEDGWYLAFTGLASGFGGDLGTYLSIDHVSDHEHLVIGDPTRCLTTTTQLDAASLVGSATCRGARWSDFFDQYSGFGAPMPSPAEPTFDAEITFEAH